MPGGNSASACQTIAGSCPEVSRNARAMSRSRLMPGKTSTADFMALRSRSSEDLDAVIFDDRVGKQFFGGFSECRLGASAVGAVDLDVENLTLPHAGDTVHAERAQSALDGLALRVEDAGLQCNRDAGLHDDSSAPSIWRNRSRRNGCDAVRRHRRATRDFRWVSRSSRRTCGRRNGPVASALDEDGTRALRPLAFAHDAEPFGDLGIRLQQPAAVAAETVLVELLVRFDVPQATGIWRNLVGDDDPHHVVLPQPTSLHLEIDQANANAEEQPGKKVVDADGQRHDVVDLLRRRPAERGNMLLRYHRIVELVILVIEFDDRARQLRAFLDAEPLRQRAGGDVTHNHFERHDLDFANELLAHVESADEMRRHADVVEVLEDVFRNPVVEHALAFDHLMLFGIEGGRIVLEVLDQSSWLGPFVEDLRLAFIDTATAAHRSIPWLGEIHWIGRGSSSIVEVRGSATGARLKRGPSATGKLAERDAEHNRHRPAPLPPQRSSCDRVTVALTRHAR